MAAELDALGDAGGWRPAPGEWSANECVGHLLEAERRGFAGRIRHILAEDRPALVDLGSAGGRCRPPGRPAGRSRSWRPSSSRCGPRASALVGSLTSADLGRVGIHPEVGELRVDELLGEWVHHDRNHVRQLLAVTQARVWEQMGNARRFSLAEG